MLNRKKITDYFPDFSKTLALESWRWRDWIKKYDIASSGSYNIDGGYIPNGMCQIVNFDPEAKVLAFEIDFNWMNNCIVTVDFQHQDTVKAFQQACSESLQNLLSPVEAGVLIKTKTRPYGINYFPHAHPVSYSATVNGIQGRDNLEEKRKMVDEILLAIHEIDPFDIRILPLINNILPFAEFKSIQSLLQLKTSIQKELDEAYARGAVSGFFAKQGLPRDIQSEIVKYIQDVKDGASVGITCQQAHHEGALATRKVR